MRLILVRHGETEHNRGQLTLGRADVPLNERGREQAIALGASFDVAPAAIFSSPLMRTLQTAREIGRVWTIDPVVDERLIEMDVGEMEHLATHELRDRYPDFMRAWMSADVADARMPGGETLREVQERAWEAVLDMRESHRDETVVTVTHNFVILTLLCRALELPLHQFRRLKQVLAGKTVIEIGAERAQLLQLNDTAHLAALEQHSSK